MRKYVSKVNKPVQAFSKLCFDVKSGIFKNSQTEDRQNTRSEEAKD